LNRNLVEFSKLLGERTKGAVKITFYEATLGSPTDQWDMLKNNVCQIVFVADAYSVGRIPVGSLLNMPFEVPNMAANMAIFNEWVKAGYLKELTDNFKVLYAVPTYPLEMFLRDRKVMTLEDLKGVKVRALSGIMGQTITALGATGVSMPGGEMYMALQTGVIDCVVTGVDNYTERKLYEVTKCAMKFPLYAGSLWPSMNKETWNSLPADLQQIIEQTAQEVSSANLKRGIDEESGLWDAAAKRGAIVYEIGPEERARWKKATAGVADKYVQEWAAKGYPVKEALELMRKVASKF
jgi:TRAP-type C4-dicarboxylate transport system substrate-binding protein